MNYNKGVGCPCKAIRPRIKIGGFERLRKKYIMALLCVTIGAGLMAGCGKAETVDSSVALVTSTPTPTSTPTDTPSETPTATPCSPPKWLKSD